MGANQKDVGRGGVEGARLEGALLEKGEETRKGPDHGVGVGETAAGPARSLCFGTTAFGA